MSTWTIPTVPEDKLDDPPPIAIAITLLAVTVVVGVAIAIANWEIGKPLLSAKIVTRAFIAPLLTWGILCGLLYTGYETAIHRVALWNFLCRDTYVHWRQWAQRNVAVLDVVVLTPEPQLAERMLGLDGTAPLNTGKSPTLERNRFDDVMTQLIEPVLPHLRRFAGKRTIQIVLQSAHETHLTALRAVLQTLDLPQIKSIGVSRVAPEACNALLEQWVTHQRTIHRYGHAYGDTDERYMADVCLLLACQLQEDGTPPCAEAATALLLGSMSLVVVDKLKPKARLFRPIPTASDDVLDALKTLTTAEPTPVDRFRHAWTSHLPKRDGHIMRAAMPDAEPALTLHDLDQALGLPGPASAVLLQALATQMVQYGQGPQLVIVPDAAGVRLNLVSHEYANVKRYTTPEFAPFNVSTSMGLTCGIGCFFLLVNEASALSAGWVWSLIGIWALLLVVVQPLGNLGIRNMIEVEFDKYLSRLRSRA